MAVVQHVLVYKAGGAAMRHQIALLTERWELSAANYLADHNAQQLKLLELPMYAIIQTAGGAQHTAAPSGMRRIRLVSLLF